MKCFPPGFFVAGKDHDHSVGIVRTRHNNKFVIGKFVEGSRPFVPNGDGEIEIGVNHIFEIICDSQLKWETYNAKVPAYAFVAGHTEDGREVYIGKTNMEGNTVVGRIQDNMLHFTWSGSGRKSGTFEILVLN